MQSHLNMCPWHAVTHKKIVDKIFYQFLWHHVKKSNIFLSYNIPVLEDSISRAQIKLMDVTDTLTWQWYMNTVYTLNINHFYTQLESSTYETFKTHKYSFIHFSIGGQYKSCPDQADRCSRHITRWLGDIGTTTGHHRGRDTHHKVRL